MKQHFQQIQGTVRRLCNYTIMQLCYRRNYTATFTTNTSNHTTALLGYNDKKDIRLVQAKEKVGIFCS